jgi:hypothetical protein
MQEFRTARFSDTKGGKKYTPRISRFRHNIIRFTRLNILNARSSFKGLRVPVARQDIPLPRQPNEERAITDGVNADNKLSFIRDERAGDKL